MFHHRRDIAVLCAYNGHPTGGHLNNRDWCATLGIAVRCSPAWRKKNMMKIRLPKQPLVRQVTQKPDMRRQPASSDRFAYPLFFPMRAGLGSCTPDYRNLK